MSRFTNQHRKGISAFTRRLEQMQHSCENCGFEAAVLHGEWTGHVHRDPSTGHLQYRLTCPHCDTVDHLDLDL